jgi:hypothetical protein
MTARSATGFTRVAQLLTRHYGEPVTRQQVYEWWQRGTRNQAGQVFPSGRAISAPARRPGRRFSSTEVLAWTEAGVPRQHGAGWRQLGEWRPQVRDGGRCPDLTGPYLNGSGLHPDEAAPFAGELARGEVPSIRRIRSELHVGQPRAQEIQARLAPLTHTERIHDA